MPVTMRQHEAKLRQPAFCELLPVRDYLDNVIVRSNGALVAGYALGGINSYYHSDETRNQTKYSLEALVRSLTERSMRMQVRFEVVEGLGQLPAQYKGQLRSDNPVVQALDRVRLAAWKQKEQASFYLTPVLHAYLYWDPRIHHEATGDGVGKKLGKMGAGWSGSANKCIQRARREHDDLVSEFESILKGIEQTLTATGMNVRRLTDEEMFLELKRAMNPLFRDEIAYRRPELTIDYRSAREQAANTHIEDDQEAYINIGGLLYSFLSLKDLPDATFPGILRELLGLDFPLVINTEVSIPDQAERLKLFKGRLRRMTAAQRDSKGGFKVNVDARVAEGQLMQTLQDLISSSLKSAQVSIVVGVRTSTPVQSRRDLEEQERVLADRRQRALHAIMRMNGARGLPEDLAKRRLYINGLPGMTAENKREHDCFTLHAADLLMVESPVERHAELAADSAGNAVPATRTVFPVRPEPQRRQRPDHREIRRRKDLHGADVPDDDGAAQSVDLDSGAREFVSAARGVDGRPVHRRGSGGRGDAQCLGPARPDLRRRPTTNSRF